MIANKDKKAEQSKQSKFIPKPTTLWYEAHGNPEKMGLFRLQGKNKKKK
jgi:hypothetical protein